MNPLLKVGIKAASLVFTAAAAALLGHGVGTATNQLIERLEGRALASSDAMHYQARLEAIDDELEKIEDKPDG